MRNWLRKLWAELKRDHLAEQAAARELFEKAVSAPELVEGNPTCPECHVAGKLCGFCADIEVNLAYARALRSPENSPEAVKPESRKLK